MGSDDGCLGVGGCLRSIRQLWRGCALALVPVCRGRGLWGGRFRLGWCAGGLVLWLRKELASRLAEGGLPDPFEGVSGAICFRASGPGGAGFGYARFCLPVPG